MPISFDEVQHVARLARLELTEEELFAFQNELNALLGHFQDIADLSVPGNDALPRHAALFNVWAEDEAILGFERALAMRNAPKTRAGLFVVPTIIEE